MIQVVQEVKVFQVINMVRLVGVVRVVRWSVKSSLLKTKELTDPWRTHVKGVNLVLLEIICIGNGVFNSEDVFITLSTFPDIQFE